MQLLYKVATRDLTLLVDRDSPTSRQPIISSHHHTNLYFDAVVWNPTRDSIMFTAFVAPEHKTFAVESMDYFVFDQFWAYRGVMNFNPIGIMYRYWKEHNRRRRFTLTDLFTAYRTPELGQQQFKLARTSLAAVLLSTTPTSKPSLCYPGLFSGGWLPQKTKITTQSNWHRA
jgi:hypothetical protein